MEMEGVVRDGIIVPDAESTLPEGTRVRISVASSEAIKPFGQRFEAFKGAVPELPADLAKEHDHYRLGSPKR